jgi:pimeloyl-ACP methyl ester carboxylesterase
MMWQTTAKTINGKGRLHKLLARWSMRYQIYADCGHFLCEEAPDATAKALIEFFTR